MNLCECCDQASCCCSPLPPPPRQELYSCPPHDRRHIQAEFPVEPFICSSEVCKIFGSHDRNENPKPAYPRGKSTALVTNTLGSPIGLIKSSFGVKTIDAKGNDLHALRFGTYIKAFANIYLTPEDEWDPESMDMILTEGQKLFNDSKQKNPANDDIVLLDIYSDLEAKICRTFDLKGYNFQIELNDKFQAELTDKVAMQGQKNANRSDLNIQFVKIALKQFFKQSCYCLLKLSNWYLLVWRDKGVYFVLDVYGRRVHDFVSDRDKGVAMLICLKSLNNVEHLIRNLSVIQKTETFNLRELRVVKLTGPDGKTMSREYGKRVNEYEIVNSTYAYLKSVLHLSLNPAETLRRRSAFPAGIAALLASKIDHPATWNEKVLDKIICYGVYVCRHCWEQCLRGYGHQTQPEDISRFPSRLKIGQYYASYKLTPRYCEGVWKCVPNYKYSELAVALEQCFNNGIMNLLIQLGQQFYAVWKKHNIFYLFDPYRHRICWNMAVDEKHSTLRMFSSLESFFSVFQQLLLESNKTAKFYVHTLQVTLLESVYKVDGVSTMESLPLTRDGEDVKSLNETICFEEDETQCLKELGEISDYEDEDMIIGVAQIDLSSESETDAAEEGMEEEEGGGKMNMDDVESSSSGDGHGGRRRKQKRSKSARDRSKAKKDKSTEKSKKKGKKDTDKDKGKSKKKGAKDKSKDKNKEKKKEKDDTKNKKKKGKNKPPKEDKEKETKDKKKSKKSKKIKDDATDSETDAGKKKDKKKKKKEANDSGSEEDDQTDKKKKKQKEKKEKTKDEGDSEKENADKNKDKEKKKGKDKEDNQDKTKNAEKDKDADKKKEKEKEKEKSKDDNKEKDKPKDKEVPKVTKMDSDKQKTEDFDQSEKLEKHDQNNDVKSKAKSRYADRGYDGDDDEDTRDQLENKPNNYPGYSNEARNMAVVGSESGTYESICKLLRAGFKCADRIMTMTPWGNYVVFRGYSAMETLYFLFDGCTCNVNRFRHLDLNCGTAGLLCFESLHDVITYMIDTRKMNPCIRRQRRNVVDDICREYC